MEIKKLLEDNEKLVKKFGASPASELKDVPDFYTFKKNLISGLADEYNTKVLMFHWQSKSGPIGFPEDKARQSGKDLFEVFKKTNKFKQDNKALVKDVNFILLTHSMGSIVLEESMKHTNSSVKNLFDTLVISASASNGKTHKQWVDKLNLSNNQYVLVNNNDPMLGFAGKKMKGRRLGRNLNSRFGRKFKLSDKATYIDITRGDLEHRYYLKNDLRNTSYIKKFFKQVLTGSKAQLNNQSVYKKRRNDSVYVLRK